MGFLDFIPLVGDVVKGVTGLIGTHKTNKTNRQIADGQNALNYRMFQEQNKFNVDMWNAQNAYNTPQAQVDRLRQAGINPYLALSNIQTGQAGNVTSATPAPAVGYDYKSPISELGYNLGQGAQDTYNAIQRSKEVEASVELAKANRRNVDADTLSKISDADFRDERNRVEIEKIRQEINKSRADENYVNAQTAGKLLENKRLEELTPVEIEHAKQSLKLLGEQIDWQKVNNDIAKFDLQHLKPLQKQQAEATIKATYQSIYSMIIDGQLKQSQIGLVYQQTLKTAMEAQGISISNDILSRGANAQVGLLNQQLDNARKQGKLIDAQTSNTKEHTREYLFRRGFDGVKLGIEAFQRQQQLGINALDAFVPL